VGFGGLSWGAEGGRSAVRLRDLGDKGQLTRDRMNRGTGDGNGRHHYKIALGGEERG